MTRLQQAYQNAVDLLNGLRERKENGETGLAEQIKDARDKMGRAHDAATAETNAAISNAPVALRLNADGRISVSQHAGSIGGRLRFVSPGEPEYPALLERMKANESLDARVAAVAFSHWGWRGAVRIDYFGTGKDECAIVSRGKDKVSVRTSDMTIV